MASAHFIIVFTIIIAVPLSRYMAKIMDGKYRPRDVLRWFEKRLDSGPQNWKQYTVALLIFNTVLFVYGYIVLVAAAMDAAESARPRHAGADHDLPYGHLVHHQYQHAALFGRRGIFEFQPDLLLHRDVFSFRGGWIVRACGDHPRASRRF